MASVKKRPDGSYRARVRTLSGREVARHFTLKRDADKWVVEQEAALLAGTFVDPRKGRTLVSTAAEGWVAAQDWKASTAARNRSILDKHVLPRWGSVPVSRVQPEDVQKWVTQLSTSGLAPRSVRKVFFVLGGVMKYAVLPMRVLAVAPTVGIVLPSAETAGTEDADEDVATDRRYLTGTEVEALAAAAGDGRLVVLTLAYSGLRWGELAALRVADVDTLRGRLRVRRAVTEVNGRLVWGTPKGKARRTVPVPAFLSDELKAHVKGRDMAEPLFPAPRGGVLRVRAARRAWFDDAVEVAGLGSFHPHLLRHTAASLAVSAGANVLAVSRMLGHKRPSLTLDVYADLFDGDLDDVAGRLDAARAQNLADFLRTEAEGKALRVVQS